MANVPRIEVNKLKLNEMTEEITTSIAGRSRRDTMSSESLASSFQSTITGRSRLGSSSFEDYTDRHSGSGVRGNNDGGEEEEDDQEEGDDGDEDDDNDDDDDDDENENDNQNAQYDEEDDPLGVKKLALSFDYLLYKIGSKMESLAEQTELSVVAQQKQVDEQIIDVDRSLQKLRRLMKECDELETDFIKLEQIGVIVREFKERIERLESYF